MACKLRQRIITFHTEYMHSSESRSCLEASWLDSLDKDNCGEKMLIPLGQFVVGYSRDIAITTRLGSRM